MTHSTRRWAPLVLVLALTLGPALPVDSVAADTIADKRAEAERLAEELEAKAAEAGRMAEAYNQARLAARDAEAAVAEARAEVEAARTQLDEHRARVRTQAVTAYMRGGSAPSIEALSRTGSAADLALQQAYLRNLSSQLADAIDALRTTRADAERSAAAAAAAASTARARAGEVESRRRAAAEVVASQQAVLARVQGELTSLVEAEQRRRAEEEARRARQAQAEQDARRRATTTTTARPGAPAPTGPTPGSGTPAPNPGAAAAVEEARKQIGKPYQWGGEGPDSFDCSGLVLWAWKAGGRRLPHSAQAQYNVTTHIDLSQIAPGDIVFFGSSTSNIHHNGLYVGDGQMIEASQTGTPVRYRSIARRDLVGVGRVN